jgi:RimJ/RimL family protein N-acetyltransferase
VEIRRTVMDDLDRVMEIYDDARSYMRVNGNPNQWGDGYPSIELIKKDISEEKSYVCVDKNQILGVFYYSIGLDSTYLNIYEGTWLSENSYSVVHRIASRSHKKGVASFCLNWCLNNWPNIRIDTHKDNIIMQKFLIKNGFIRCGIIYLEDGSERIAYQKVL